MLNFENYTITEKLGCLTDNQSELFTPNHEKHHLTITVLNNDNGEKYTYRTQYQYCPMATKYRENDGILAVINDADAYVGTRYLENFVDEFGYTDMKQATKAFNACKRAFKFFIKSRINEARIAAIREYLDQ